MDTDARPADDRRQLVMIQRQRSRYMAPWSRREVLAAIAGVALVGPTLGVAGSAHASLERGASPAADDERLVAVPHLAFGAVVAAIAGRDVAIEVDPALAIDAMRMGDVTVSVADRLLLKGEGNTRGRYLDDARNAPKLGAAVRDRLHARWPELGEGVALRHKAWSRALVRNVLR
jgi:hypothetical protein